MPNKEDRLRDPAKYGRDLQREEASKVQRRVERVRATGQSGTAKELDAGGPITALDILKRRHPELLETARAVASEGFSLESVAASILQAITEGRRGARQPEASTEPEDVEAAEDRAAAEMMGMSIEELRHWLAQAGRSTLHGTNAEAKQQFRSIGGAE
jgi:hypothetical protein